jgi:hypothetical protein
VAGEVELPSVPRLAELPAAIDELVDEGNGSLSSFA